jgi:hypothetical protein
MRPIIVSKYCIIIVYCKLYVLIALFLFYFLNYYRSLEIPNFNDIHELIGFCQLNSYIFLEAFWVACDHCTKEIAFSTVLELILIFLFGSPG